MIFLLNKPYVVWECVELARLHMCEVLRVPPSAIIACLELSHAKLSPEFQVDAEQCKGVSPDQIREVMGDVYGQVKDELKTRLYGLDRTREDVMRELHRDPKEDAGSA